MKKIIMLSMFAFIMTAFANETPAKVSEKCDSPKCETKKVRSHKKERKEKKEKKEKKENKVKKEGKRKSKKNKK